MKNIKTVVVVGMGVSGISALNLLKYLGKTVYAVNQGETSSWGTGLGLDEKYLISQNDKKLKEVLATADLVVLSPGIPRDVQILKDFKGPIWCEVELAYRLLSSSDEKIIAVTGTNGKTTTVSLLEECLKASGKEFFIGGNIGTPFCDYVLEVISNKRKIAEVIVLELSSFQLESLDTFRANAAAILNITFSHGERYDDIKPYAFAKFNIFNNQQNSDIAIMPQGMMKEFDFKMKSSSSLKLIENSDLDELSNIVDLEKLKIVGVHNHKNILFAYHLWVALGLPIDSFLIGCYSFTGVHYRLEYLGKLRNFEVFNDSKSTNWEATETAIIGVKDRGPVTLIIGGQKRGHGDDRIDVLLPYLSSLSKILLIGESGVGLESKLRPHVKVSYVQDLEGAFKEITSDSKEGVLLFSPAFPSFDQFKNYVERGKKFTNLFKNSLT
ncbi:UDP-N-acetylmuramoyl-L-alanine--D-glutamate ligase [Bacteriovorax sp. Seq25_V]|uniref:UDP-N-acetylmuramoyl-L-alanine--D-glutamate ligase n=1 Tax=Bacteriovorax sp. Seq25_V TaxID=1201288 RepID=UPI00038A2991|nr:UDP-N-acetylmuramoyl-L-alanine--D-glutamate ligase [Bacteriovorax sp. Seq25_V]EQC43741.1 UDP-N-acetylmuramoyl-L-alanine--D-glutamate ligase [Bacteriovorax sp. Seq25_V]